MLTWALIALALIDLDHHLLPDIIVLPLLWVGLLLSITGLLTDPKSAILGATLGYITPWLVFQIVRLITGKKGMGYGDFKLLAMLGAWVGWQALFQILMFATLLGLFASIPAAIRKRGADPIRIPFGPFLAFTGWLTLILGVFFEPAF